VELGSMEVQPGDKGTEKEMEISEIKEKNLI